jgi:hypothetical protein
MQHDPSPTVGDGIRIFNITDPTSGTNPPQVTLKGLTLTGADVSGNGGAIFADAQLEIIKCVVTGNSATIGGGIFASVRQNSELTIVDSVISGNAASVNGGGIYSSSQTDTSITITDTEITGNSARDGGGVFAAMGERPSQGPSSHTNADGSVLTIQRSRVDGNTAVNRGGGLYTATGSGGTVEIAESVITGNEAGIGLQGGAATLPNSGGGMYAFLFSYQEPARLTIATSEVSENVAGQSGGGLQVCTKREDTLSEISEVSVYNSTISGNTAGPTTAPYDPSSGGGVHLAIYDSYSDPEEALDARFQNVTITNNKADVGGGVFSLVTTNNNPVRVNDVRLTNSIVSKNFKNNGTDHNNLHGSFNVTETVFNLIGTGNTIFEHDTHDPGSLSIQNILNNNDPKLGALAFNGGLTRTHGLLSDSAAIDAGDDDRADIPFTSTPLATDQRGTGFSRLVDISGVHDPGEKVDIGAYEVNLARVKNVVLKGSGWGTGVEYSYAEVVAAGNQHRPMFIKNANRIEVHFDSAVSFPTNQADALVIFDEHEQEIAATIAWVGYDANTFVATWSVSSVLGPGKYAIQVIDVTGAGGTEFDGDWMNLDGPLVGNQITHTPDNFADDPGQTLLSGNGVEGGLFQFHFSVLPGDYNQDGKVRNATGPSGEPSDLLTILDGDGDGAPSDTTDDTAIVNNAVTAGDVALDASKYTGDYMDDDNVDGDIPNGPIHLLDYMKWKHTFGFTSGLEADGSDNGIVDAADYTLWRANAPYMSAWYTGGMGTAPACPSWISTIRPR